MAKKKPGSKKKMPEHPFQIGSGKRWFSDSRPYGPGFSKSKKKGKK